MPRRRQPQSLRHLSVSCLASTVLQVSKRSNGHNQDGISQFVQDIPEMFANEYVLKILRLYSEAKDAAYSISRAFHPKCTKITAEDGMGYLTLPSHSYCQLFMNLHVMNELQVFKAFFCGRDESAVHDVLRSHPFPNLSKLREVSITQIPDAQHLEQVIENCPLLENVMTEGLLTRDIHIVSSCRHLKTFWAYPINPDVAVHLLENLPNLECLSIENVPQLLPLCTRAYPLKRFASYVKPIGVADIPKLVTHFPHLEDLNLNIDSDADASPINHLLGLKRFIIRRGSASRLVCLRDVLMGRISWLTILNVTNLNLLFSLEMKLPSAQLKSLIISGCTGINVAAIGQIFPDLQSLDLFGSEFEPLPPCQMMTGSAFQALEELKINQNVPMVHAKYLLSASGNKLKELQLSNSSDVSTACELLSGARLKELREIVVSDAKVTKDVIPIILAACGDHLAVASVCGDNMEMSVDEDLALKSQLRPYDMIFDVSTPVTFGLLDVNGN